MCWKSTGFCHRKSSDVPALAPIIWHSWAPHEAEWACFESGPCECICRVTLGKAHHLSGPWFPLVNKINLIPVWLGKWYSRWKNLGNWCRTCMTQYLYFISKMHVISYYYLWSHQALYHWRFFTAVIASLVSYCNVKEWWVSVMAMVVIKPVSCCRLQVRNWQEDLECLLWRLPFSEERGRSQHGPGPSLAVGSAHFFLSCGENLFMLPPPKVAVLFHQTCGYLASNYLWTLLGLECWC